MKTNLFKYIAVAGGLFIANVMFNSCSNEELISIDKIYIHSLDDTTTELSKVRLGQMIRIQGSGFSTTKAIYCNGVEISGVNTNYITDDCIILKIPSDLPTGSDVEDENVRNTIRVVTEYDEFVYKFDILAASPTITSVSHTLPRAGEWIDIYGTSFKDIEYVTFPGGVNSTEFSVNEDYTILSVKVPEGIGENYGELTVYGANGGAYSYSDFNFKSGQFIWQFSNDSGDKAFNYGSNNSANLTDVIPTEGNGAKSPDCYRAIPGEPATTPKEGEIGGFNFYADKAIQIVLDANSGNGAITEKTKCSELAFQCDMYINIETWTTAALRLDLNGNRNTLTPWLQNASVVAYAFENGWKTMTWAIKDIPTYANMTLGDLKSALTGKNARIIWLNGQFQDASGNWFSGTEMKDAQIYLGNFRLVPYTKKNYVND